MRKTIIALAGTTALLCGSLVWAAHANSPTSSGASFPHNSPTERIGCTQSGDNCPYGYRIERHDRKGWSCKPCWDQKQGSRHRDDDDEYYEPRRYRQYGEEYYGPRRYRDYDDGYYEPRRYREY